MIEIQLAPDAETAYVRLEAFGKKTFAILNVVDLFFYIPTFTFVEHMCGFRGPLLAAHFVADATETVLHLAWVSTARPMLWRVSHVLSYVKFGLLALGNADKAMRQRSWVWAGVSALFGSCVVVRETRWYVVLGTALLYSTVPLRKLLRG